jgi:NAD(P)-dependent dehydrogenase (short-subunit alcohol dehydrogenase family)
MNDSTRKVVVITGATGNLGSATADVFLKSDARLVLVDRLVERLRIHYTLLVDSPDHFLAGECDVANYESVVGMVQRTLERFGRIDVLVNSVGGYRGGKRVDESDLKEWDFLLETNFRTALHCCRAVAPHFIQQRSGRIINIAGRAALSGSGHYGAYCVSKAAVLRLTESLSDELKEFGINVNCVLPGTIDTPQNRKAMPEADFSRWVLASSIAEVIGFLASDAACAVTGAAIPVYGRS